MMSKHKYQLKKELCLARRVRQVKVLQKEKRITPSWKVLLLLKKEESNLRRLILVYLDLSTTFQVILISLIQWIQIARLERRRQSSVLEWRPIQDLRILICQDQVSMKLTNTQWIKPISHIGLELMCVEILVSQWHTCIQVQDLSTHKTLKQKLQQFPSQRRRK